VRNSGVPSSQPLIKAANCEKAVRLSQLRGNEVGASPARGRVAPQGIPHLDGRLPAPEGRRPPGRVFKPNTHWLISRSRLPEFAERRRTAAATREPEDPFFPLRSSRPVRSFEFRARKRLAGRAVLLPWNLF